MPKLTEKQIVADNREVRKILQDRNGLKVTVNDTTITGWLDFSITRSLLSGVGSFTITSVDIQEAATRLLDVNAKVVLSIGSDVIMTGRIYSKVRNISESNVSTTFSGRDVIADIVDCAAITRSNFWSNESLEKISQDICDPFEVFVDGTTDGEKFPNFAIQPGETAYEAISRGCKQKGILAIGDRFGNLELKSFDPKTLNKSIVPLVLGNNIKSITESIDYSGRFSETYVKGQGTPQKRTKGQPPKGERWRRSDIQKVGTATDEIFGEDLNRSDGKPRYRPTILVSETKGVTKFTRDRAAWQAQVSAGNSRSYNVTVQGFRQKTSKDSTRDPLWLVSSLVRLRVDEWTLDEEFIISDVTFTFSEASGSVTSMTLKNKSTFAPDPKGKVEF